MMEVVKVIPDPEDRGFALVYARNHDRTVRQPLDWSSKRIAGNDREAYFEGEWSPSKQQWRLGRRVKNRAWPP